MSYELNLFDLHSNPEKLHGYDKRNDLVPLEVYNKVSLNPPGTLEQQKVIAKSPRYSLFYAINVINKPFPLGEKAISSNGGYAYRYASSVLKKPFPLGEKAMLSESNWLSIEYSTKILKKRWPELEKILFKNKHKNYYLDNIIKIYEQHFNIKL
jgi:hypothetical protein